MTKPFEFRGSDFINLAEPVFGEKDSLDIIADRASAKLREWLRDAPVVYCRVDDGKWACDEHPGFAGTTHMARLVCIEEAFDVKCDKMMILTIGSDPRKQNDQAI